MTSYDPAHDDSRYFTLTMVDHIVLNAYGHGFHHGFLGSPNFDRLRDSLVSLHDRAARLAFRWGYDTGRSEYFKRRLLPPAVSPEDDETSEFTR